LLIAGEYLITEEGGTGLAIAAGGRSYLTIKKSINKDSRQKTALLMEGNWPGGHEEWSAEEDDTKSLASAVWKNCRRKDGYFQSPANGEFRRITVETHEFYDSLGRKLGFGSSAAAALLYARGIANPRRDPPEVPGNMIIDCALKAHRAWQGGHGSGYDILTSANGGFGKFTAGMNPHWETLNWPKGLEGWLIRGGGIVSSPNATNRFKHWRINSNREKASLLTGMRKDIESFISFLLNNENPDPGSPDPALILEYLHRMAESGIRLGEKISVPASPVFPGNIRFPLYRRESMVVKCLGAGNETILLLCLPDGLQNKEIKVLRDLEQDGSAMALKIELEGLKRE